MVLVLVPGTKYPRSHPSPPPLTHTHSFDQSVMCKVMEASRIEKQVDHLLRLHSVDRHVCMRQACACMYTHMHTYTHTHMRTCAHAHMHTCTHAHMHTCTHAHIHTYVHTCVRTCIHTCVHLSIHSSIHLFIHPCMHTHTHTHAHTHTLTHSLSLSLSLSLSQTHRAQQVIFEPVSVPIT
jgi:hypothetical protein